MTGTRRKPGRMGPYVDGYRARLLELGYTQGSTKQPLLWLGQVGRWMEREGLQVGELDGRMIEAFFAARRANEPRRVPGRRGVRIMLVYLLDVGALTAEDLVEELTPLDEVLGEYRRWLVGERGLAAATVIRYEMIARRFLAGRATPGDAAGTGHLSGGDVAAFLLAECGRVSVPSAKGRVCELRSLLRFLYLRGFTPVALGDAIPPVAGWRDTGIPSTMGRGEVDRLLAACDRDQLQGARNFAILMLLARLGLRSIEVSRLELEDLRWRAGEIIVRGKARRQDVLPLPREVGEALAGYLSLRGHHDERRVFLTVRAPTRPIRADLVGDVVQRACLRAGVGHVGAHQLRHQLARELLREGASLIDVSQVLRHRDLATTAIYAKVDLGRLRMVAQPWPGTSR